MNEENSAPVEKVSDHAHQIVVREVARSRFGFQMGIGLLGLGAAAGGVASGYLVNSSAGSLLPLLVAVSVVGFGLVSLMSWRRSGEFEIVEVSDGRLRLVTSKSSGFAFDAPIEQAKIQRVRHSLGLRLCLRDGVRAVELGNHLTPQQREMLAERIEAAVANAREPAAA